MEKRTLLEAGGHIKRSVHILLDEVIEIGERILMAVAFLASCAALTLVVWGFGQGFSAVIDVIPGYHFNGLLIDSDAVLAQSKDSLLNPDDPSQEAMNYLLHIYVMERILCLEGYPTDDIDELVDTSGSLYKYSVGINCIPNGKQFVIYAEGKNPPYDNFMVDHYGFFKQTD